MERFLRDHVCIVTGGTQGLGWAIVQALADHGAQVYAVGRSRESLDRAETERASLPWADAIHLSRCDVTDRAAYEAWIEGVLAGPGRVDVLVNNAAYVQWTDVTEMSVAAATQTMRVAYDGMVFGIKAVLPGMLASGRGHIVNVGSITGNIFVSGPSAAYAAAKAAVDAYTQILQIELKHTPVNATLVRLGTVAGTDFFKKRVPHTRMPRLLDFLPYTTPPQVAQAIVRAIHHQSDVLTLPRALSLFRILFTLAPRISRRLASLGGGGQRDYAPVEWDYHR